MELMYYEHYRCLMVLLDFCIRLDYSIQLFCFHPCTASRGQWQRSLNTGENSLSMEKEVKFLVPVSK